VYYGGQLSGYNIIKTIFLDTYFEVVYWFYMAHCGSKWAYSYKESIGHSGFIVGIDLFLISEKPLDPQDRNCSMELVFNF
jgi:hypothetical protein